MQIALVLNVALLMQAPADLTKIERSIVKEPAYQTKSPKYCLLVFGLDAKTRVWLVQDGDALYVDRGADGDLTRKENRVEKTKRDGDFRVFEVGDLAVGGLTHSKISVAQMKTTEESVRDEAEWKRVQENGAEPWTWWVRITAERGADDKRDLPKKVSYVINGDGAGNLLFAVRPQDAPIIHINGPFTLALQDWRQQLAMEKPTMLQIGVGPQGLGPGTFAFVLYPDTIPKDVYPKAEIDFPAKETGAEPIRRDYTLKKRC